MADDWRVDRGDRWSIESTEMIRTTEYFGNKPYSVEHENAATDLLERVNRLIDEAVESAAFLRAVDPDTGTEISGSRGGSGDGGFRLPNATTGKQNSSHKEAKGVDCYDPEGDLDEWLDTFETGGGKNTKLEEHGLYREHPTATAGWCHLSTRAPGSGRRTFFP